MAYQHLKDLSNFSLTNYNYCLSVASNGADKATDAVLHVQRGVSLCDDVGADAARLLPASGLRGEDRPGDHSPAGLLGLHAGGGREPAGDI